MTYLTTAHLKNTLGKGDIMKCTICEREFKVLIEATLCDTKRKTRLKKMCMECFFRVSGLASVYSVRALPEIWDRVE